MCAAHPAGKVPRALRKCPDAGTLCRISYFLNHSQQCLKRASGSGGSLRPGFGCPEENEVAIHVCCTLC